MNRPYYGWIVVCGCFVGSFVVFGLSYSFGVFFERLLDSFGYSRGVTAVAFGVQTLALYVGASVVGTLVDRYGTRRMLLVGTVLVAAGLLWASVADSLVTVVLAYGVVTGLGLSVVYVVSYATVPNWFDRRLGLAGGLASAGLGVGMLVVTPAATWLVGQFGWRDAFRVLAGGAVVLLALTAVLMRDRPATAGVDPPADEFEGTAPTGDVQPWGDQVRTLVAIATSRGFVLVCTGWILVYTTLYVTLGHLVVHAGDIGLGRSTGATALAAIGAASAGGRVVIGHAADQVGRARVFVGCSAAMGVTTALLPLASSAAGLVAFGFLFGLAYGGNGALLAPLTADHFGRANLNAVFGLVSIAFAVSGLFAPPLAGYGYDTLGTYDPAFALAGGVAVVGSGLVALGTSGTG
jgi:MFS family permease